ncbi:hypothetical protein PIN31009_00460 [Pandoraea iniqua]|uniref:hypothetical protein n=1 Tax=Pandoraea iniqua TaxID=2508288 RepID=UPI0012429623|nr:hypothetical protein [Pandoraea iniqua]VVD68070.1 hypothetical protein PIN31009_00460 [Pandoraea iniqua]
MKRCIVCPSESGFKLLKAWLPTEIADSSRFFVSTGVWRTVPIAQGAVFHEKAPTLLIQNAYTVDDTWVMDQQGSAESMLSLAGSPSRYEVRMAAPTLEVMLFETAEMMDAVFGEKVTDVLRLLGYYDPQRAIREAGTTVDEIIERMSPTTIDLLRATPTAQNILDGITTLDAKYAAWEYAEL